MAAAMGIVAACFILVLVLTKVFINIIAAGNFERRETTLYIGFLSAVKVKEHKQKSKKDYIY